VASSATDRDTSATPTQPPPAPPPPDSARFRPGDAARLKRRRIARQGWFLILVLTVGIPASASAQTQPGLGAPLPQAAFSRPDLGTPEAAFADGPIRLSPTAIRLLQARFQGDKVPLTPEPFRRQLDVNFTARDWSKVMARKSDLAASRGELALLMWEQTRFLATGSIWLAELHARDLAASGLPSAGDTAAMIWLYAVAATLTDGHQCADADARDRHLQALRGAAFGPVLAIVRTLPDDRLVKQRDIALKLEAALAPDRNDDTVCGGGRPATKAADAWRGDAARTREILLRHLNAVCALVRSRPMAAPSTQALAGTAASPPPR
jgi:hypothetical protein